MCGGTPAHHSAGLHPAGLSPRVRGNRYRRRRGARFLWSIPACAGEPTNGVRGDQEQRVYPRVCGGTPVIIVGGGRSIGLSPRVRGNPDVVAVAPNAHGSIPACAGEPRGGTIRQRMPEVYPRVCGGTPSLSRRWYSAAGLSPRVRGNPADTARTAIDDGSIPACAGEPRLVPSHQPRPAVYPRVCGGTRPRKFAPCLSAGLSPRVRGNPVGVKSVSLAGGSIPACAGEPPWTKARRWNAPVYPRVCGGTPAGIDGPALGWGLSPRVRGNQ